MIEKLYQPDFSCIFGEKYANAFLYSQVDSLIWPIFNDIKKSDKLKALLKLKNNEGREYFYQRKISIEDEKVELNCSSINLGLIQAMELGSEYGISNKDVIAVVKKEPNLFRGILSYDLANTGQYEDIITNIKEIEKEIIIVGIAIYPSYIKVNLNDENNSLLRKLLSYCEEKNYFVKIDIGNLVLPNYYHGYISKEILQSFFSKYPKNMFIISGVDISGDFNLYYQLLKYFNNVWIEIDPRTIGGMTPTDFFKHIFNLTGFIQNCWHRLTIGSATPTLEISQMVRGFLEATEELPFSQKNLLRTWTFRNINRINTSLFTPIKDTELELYRTVLNINQEKIIENNNELNIIYKISLRSYSITQLIYLTQLINHIFEDTIKKYPDLKNGELFIRSYHTTTSFIVNEHEYGNYLDLHYMFAEISKKESSQFLHTSKALENRADFNPYDHQLASKYGTRYIIIPILNRKLEMGSRENFYIIVTFGPRSFNIIVKIKLIKEK